jgi:hypothetical protein
VVAVVEERSSKMGVCVCVVCKKNNDFFLCPWIHKHVI